MAKKEGEEGGNKEKKKRKKAAPKGKLCQPLDKNAINLFSREKSPTYRKGMHDYCLGIVYLFLFCFVFSFYIYLSKTLAADSLDS